MQLFSKYLKPYSRQIALVLFLLLVQAITNLYLPELNADIINEGVAKGDTAYIVATGLKMLGVTLLLVVASIVSVYWGSKVSMAFGRDLRSAFFRKVESFSQEEVNRFGTPSLITRNTNDIQQIQQVVVMSLNMIVLAPIMMVGGIVMALRQDLPLSGLIVVILPAMALIIWLIASRAMPLFKEMQKRIDRVNRVMREALAGVRVIRAFVREDYEARRFDEASTDLMETQLKVQRMFALMMPALMAVFNVSAVAVMWFGGMRIDAGAMPIGNLTAFLTYIMQILMSVMMATVMFVMVPRAAASAARIKEVLDVSPKVTDPGVPRLVAPDALRGSVDFAGVEFRYPGAESSVLQDVTFSAGPGEITAIVGSTGSGKSTLIGLIPRFYDVTAGGITLDGVDVRELARQDLWDRIGYVPQRAFLFSGTVASNLRFGDEDATDDELWHALEIAQAAEFVREMPGQLEAPITQGGTNVSGGQRQRLAIARALVKRPEVYVFDDSFSALDYATDSRLRTALKSETADATVIIVAQRVSTIMNANRIVVLDAGRIVGMGTHAELLSSNETYREIVFSQLSEEEVA